MAIKPQKKLFLILTILALIVFGIIILPIYILAFEPDMQHGLLYHHLAFSRYQAGEVSDAKELIDISLEYYPQNPRAIELVNKLKKAQDAARK